MVQIVREYLGGLIEESPLKDVFAGWTERLAGRVRPPDVPALVVPQPLKLATEALLTQLNEAEKDHFAATLPSTEHESAVDAAVDMANQTRFLSEGGTGPCAGCAPVESHDEPVREPVEDHPSPDGSRRDVPPHQSPGGCAYRVSTGASRSRAATPDWKSGAIVPTRT